MSLLTHSRTRGLLACITLTLAFALALVLAQRADAAYQVPNFSVTAAPTQAAAHPKLTLSVDPNAYNADTTGGDDLRDLTITAPAGLQLNMAAATTKCTDTQLPAGSCPGASRVGTLSVKWRTPIGTSVTLAGNAHVMTTPTAGNTASIGFLLKANGYKNMTLRASVSNAIPVSQPTKLAVTGVTRTITNSLGLTFNATIDQIDVVLNARANASASGSYFTLNPSTCGANTTKATVTTWGNATVDKASSYTTTNCSGVPFQPTATVAPTVTNLNAPTGMNTSFAVPAGELVTQSSLVSGITVATPSGVMLSMPSISSVVPCSETNLLADTCPAAAKIGTANFTFWGSSAAAGDLYMGALSSNGFEVGAVTRGANGVVSISRGSVTEYDSNGDSVADRVQLLLDRLPGATWSAASFNITSTLLRNSCPTGSSITTIQGASASTVVRTGTWLIGICPPAPETTITSGPAGPTSTDSPQFAFTSTSAASTFECQMDGSSFAPCTTPYVLPPLTDGSHQFCVRAISNGVADPSPACRTFSVDTVAPVVSIHSPGPSVSFSVNDASAVSVTCRINSGAASACTSPWTITPPSGGYSITICATDPAGNTGCSTLIVDPPPFSVTITVAPPNSTSSSTALFEFAASTAGVVFECSFDGAPFAACVSPKSYSALALGSHTFCVRGRDAVGNLSSNTACRSFTYELPPPPMQLIRTAPVSSPSSSTSASFTVTNVQAGDTLMGSLDGGPSTAFTSPKVFTGLSDGPHTFSVYAVDSNGAVSPNLSNTWVVDTIPPPAPTVSGPSGTVASTDAVISFASSEAGVTFQGSLDGAAFGAVTSPVFLSGLSHGTHTYSVRAVDFVGNVSSATTIVWVAGGDPPSVSITSGPTGSSSSTSPTFTFVGTFAGLTYECQLDGGAWFACTSPLTLAALPQGAHTFCVRGQYIGEITAPACRTWVVDTVAPPVPTLVRVSPVTSPTSSTTAQFTFTDTESPVTFQVSLDGSAYQPATSPVNLTGLTSGTHTFSVRAADPAGNISPSVSNSWTIQSTPPPLQITSGPSGYTASTSASFNFTGAQPGDVYQCQLDGGPWTACTPPFNFSALSRGTHTFCVRISNAGGTSNPVCRTWTVDTIPPQVTISPPPNVNTTSWTFTWTISDASPIVSVTCRLDSGPAAACNSPLALTGLSSGSHSLMVCATDAAGNTGCSTISWSPIDPPAAPTITSGPVGVVASTSATFTWVASAGTTQECRLDSGARSACISPRTYTGLADGPHQFCVRALNSSGPGPERCQSWTVDTIPPPPPSVTLVSPTTRPTLQTTATIAFSNAEPGASYQGSLDGGAFQPVSSPVSLTGLATGTHVYAVRGVDAAGNLGSVSSVTWTIGAPAPTVTISSPANGSITQLSSVEVSYVATTPDGAPADCDNPSPFSAALLEGPNSISVTCSDSTGQSTTATITVTRDSTPPVVTITSPVGPGGWITPTGVFSIADATPITSTTCALDGNAPVACSSPYTLPVSGEGLYTFTVCATDSALNSACASESFSWEPPIPVTTITDGPIGTVTSDSATFTFEASFSPVTFQCSLDSGAFAPCVSPKVYASLAVGTHTFCVRGVTSAGDVGATACRTWTVATPASAAPTISSLSASHGAGGATITYSASDDSGVPPTCTPASGTTFPFRSSGAAIFHVTCFDAAGNRNTASLNVGSNGPAAGLVTSLSGGPDTSTTDATPTFSYTVNRATSGPLPCSAGQTCATATVPQLEFNCMIDGAPVACGAGGYTPPDLNLGQHTFCVSARGIYSGEASAMVCRTFKVIGSGSTAPVVTITSPAQTGSATGGGSINVAYQVNGASTIPAGTTCSVDGVPSTTPSTNPAALSPGTNSIPVECTNASGSDVQKAVIARIDGFMVAVTTPAPNLTTSSSNVNVTYNQWNINSSVTCRLNGVVTTSGAVNDVPLPPGPSSIDLVCSSGGHLATSSISVRRGNPPAVAITAPADNSSAASPNVSYTVDGVEAIPAGTSCRVNGVASTSATTNSVALSSGANLITVSCSNAYGFNTATITVTNNDALAPPTVTITAPAEGTATTASAVRVDYTVTPAGATCDHVSGQNKSLSVGANTITVTCTNSAGSGAASVHVTRASNLTLSGSCTTTSSTTATCTWSQAGGVAPYVITCALDGATPSTCTGSSSTTVTFPQPITTSHTMRVCISDESNQLSCTNLAIAPPGSTGNVVNITSGPADGSSGTTTTATFTYAATQQTMGTPCPVGATCAQVIVDMTPYYCSFDNGAYQFCGVTTPTFARFTTPALVDGLHSFCVRASGVAGIDPQTHNAIPNGVYGPSTCRSFTKST